MKVEGHSYAYHLALRAAIVKHAGYYEHAPLSAAGFQLCGTDSALTDNNPRITENNPKITEESFCSAPKRAWVRRVRDILGGSRNFRETTPARCHLRKGPHIPLRTQDYDERCPETA